MTDVHPIAATVTRLAQDYPLLLTMAGTVQATTAGTIGRQTNVHRVPGGTDHHDLRRETRDVLWGYAEIVGDQQGLTDPASDDIPGNAARVAAHATNLDQATPLGCKGHARSADDTGPRTHPSVAQHLACLAHRVRTKLEPPGAREFVGPCPTEEDGTECGLDLRAYENGPARCTGGHVHDAATARSVALTAADGVLLTLTEAADRASRFTDKPVTVKALRRRVERKVLKPAYPADIPGTPAYFRWSEVRNALSLS